MSVGPESETTLRELASSHSYKDLYRQRKDDFLSNVQAMTELEEWKKRNDDYDYKAMRSGLIPPGMIGKGMGKASFSKSDTWFSEFEAHNDRLLKLSESTNSIIIGNLASYDRRQYPLWHDSKYTDGHTPEGQGFGHCLVIPKRRVFNIVDPDAIANKCELIRELKAHFLSFWNGHGPSKLLDQVRLTFDTQNDKLRQDGNADSLSVLLQNLEADFLVLSEEFQNLRSEDFQYGFHAYPDNSVGHLHMHVFPKTPIMRQFSTAKHDWKTIPLEAILDLEEES